MKPVPAMPNFRDAAIMWRYLLFVLPGGTLMFLIATWWVHRHSIAIGLDEMAARFKMRIGLPKKDPIAAGPSGSWDSENQARSISAMSLIARQEPSRRGKRAASSGVEVVNPRGAIHGRLTKTGPHETAK